MSDLKQHFTRKCPACDKEGTFVPELLFRRCLQPWTRADVNGARSDPAARRDYASEPARFLLNDAASARYTFGDAAANRRIEASDNERIDVIFAAVCPNSQCRSPILLRVAGPKSDFIKIVRKRQGLPNGMSEEDLRLLHPDEVAEAAKSSPEFKYSLELLDTLPRSPQADLRQPWCNIELGALCVAIDELAPAKLKTTSDTQVRSTAETLISEMLIKLEVKKLVIEEFQWRARKARAQFGFLMDWSRLLSPEKRPAKAVTDICNAAVNEATTLDEALDLFLMGHSAGDVTPSTGVSQIFDASRRALETELRARRDRPGLRRNGRRFTIAGRLEALYHAGLAPREMWRWAERIQRAAPKPSGPGAPMVSDRAFVNAGAKAEIAAFARTLAQRAFEHPFVAAEAMREHQETKFQAIPIKERGPDEPPA